ncbi:MAG: glycosyltransferase family 39 protein [Desulfobulbaceae bacterium]|nr:glycosyltransferase family 39 protein [Desulfobulbaceae bacterium]
MCKTRKVRSDLTIFFLFLGAALILRTPSFYCSVFDWDESSQILLGQSILDGNLPYVSAWVMKPPIDFLFYSLFILIFGKSILAIRAGGIVLIAFAATLLAKAGTRLANGKAGLAAGLLLIVHVSSRRWGLATMPEHILLLPSCLFLFLMTFKQDRNISLAIGLAMGIGSLIRTNMVFDAIAFGVLILSGLLMPNTSLKERGVRLLYFSAGLLSPLALVLTTYAANDKLTLFINTNVTAVLGYVGQELTLSDKWQIFAQNIREDFLNGNYLLWMLVGIALLLLPLKGPLATRRYSVAIIAILASQLASIFYTGTNFAYHYLIMATPIMTLMAGVSIDTIAKSMKVRGKISAVYWTTTLSILALLPFLCGQGNLMTKHSKVINHLIGESKTIDDPCGDISAYLNKIGVANRYILMMNSCQIVYWQTGAKYPTKYIHPSDLLEKEYMLQAIDGPDATRENELKEILEKRPKFIIWRRDKWPQPNKTLDTILRYNLDLFYTIDTEMAGHIIYKMKEL